MALTNKQLRKQLKDALADQKGTITAKLAAGSSLSSAERKILQSDLADQKGLVASKLAQSGSPAVAATALLNITADITFTSVASGASRNTNTFTLQVLAAAANPTDTVLVAFTGTASAIVCTVTPNDGTNNLLTPVGLTSAELRELINSGVVVGKTVTVTDASSLRNDQTASGGGAQALADAGEGDGVIATFSGGINEVLSVGLSASEKKLLKDALADQKGELTDKLAAGTDFSS